MSTAPDQASSNPSDMDGRGAWRVVLLLVMGVSLTGLAVRAVKSALDDEAAQNFHYACDSLQARVEERLHAHEQILRSGAGVFADTSI
ncbi:MAG: hypothetical protein WCP35_02115 [Verrucomicrobiota bacterium]